MARVTVEDCVSLVPNRFDLVMVAAQRARDIHSGAALLVDRDRDKNPVVALREIADEKLDLDAMKDQLIRGHQPQLDTDLPEDDIIELMAGEQGWVQQAGGAGSTGEAAADGESFSMDDEDEGDEDLATENEFGNDDDSGDYKGDQV